MTATAQAAQTHTINGVVVTLTGRRATATGTTFDNRFALLQAGFDYDRKIKSWTGTMDAVALLKTGCVLGDAGASNNARNGASCCDR